MKRQKNRKPRRAKRPLTPNQRLAIDRRMAAHRRRQSLESITRLLEGDEPIDQIAENYRGKVAAALNLILYGGHLFVIACAKAMIARTDPTMFNTPELRAFIDEENARFRERVDQELFGAWNRPDYELCERSSSTAVRR